MEYSYNGWPASRDKSAIGIVDLKVNGHGFPGGCKGGDVHYLFTDFLRRYDAYVEKLTTSGGDEWGYAYRQNRNANNLSCHASGTAVDVNARTHPNGKARTLSATQVKTLRGILARYKGIIKWGGDFSGTKDEMHYEIHGTENDVRRCVTYLLAPWFVRVLRLTNPVMKGDDVLHVQRRLIALGYMKARNWRGRSNADGVYGKVTVAAVKAFQKAYRLPITGVVDWRTARKIR